MLPAKHTHNGGPATPDNWQQIQELYDAVMEQYPARRSAVLTELCKRDEVLRRQVESLIDAGVVGA